MIIADRRATQIRGLCHFLLTTVSKHRGRLRIGQRRQKHVGVARLVSLREGVTRKGLRGCSMNGSIIVRAQTALSWGVPSHFSELTSGLSKMRIGCVMMESGVEQGQALG